MTYSSGFFGGSPTSPIRFATGGMTRGRIQGGGVSGVNYPSPFFDVAHTYLPTTIKQLFKFCKYYFLTNPLINAIVMKLSEYPVTDIEVDHEDPQVVERWREYLQGTARIRPFQTECGLDYNCFHGDVRAITEYGAVRLRDLNGRTVRVLSEGGVYRPAEFKCFGKQELLEVEFRDGRTVLATSDHEWPVITSSGGTRKVKTTDLAGREIHRNVAPRPEKNDEFYEGVRHGFTYGDGTLYNGGKQARAYFCGAKDRDMLKYFEGMLDPVEREDGVLMIHGLPAYYKRLPEMGKSASYWYGFVSGFLAADGSVDVVGCTVLTQGSRAALDVISGQLPYIGMVAGKVRGYVRATEFGEGELFFLSLFKQYMVPDDFLLSSHREKFEGNYKPTKYGKIAFVTAVRETGIVDDVFCCVEPETHTFTIDNGILTGNCYGNTLVSLSFPFQKYLTCASCKFSEQASRIRNNWLYTSNEFRLSCPKCGNNGAATPKDWYYRDASGIRPIRWNVEDTEINYNEITGEYTHFYTIPATIRADITLGKKDVVEGMPQIFLQAIREQKGVVFSKNNLFHMRRATLAGQDRGWGIPLILPVLKDAFYLQIMKKAQEAILLEHIIPLRVLFPQAASGTSDPFVTTNLVDWRDQVAQEIARWRHDCVTPDTLVEAERGVVRADEVNEGDLLRNHEGSLSLVKRVWRRPLRGEELAYKIVARGLHGMIPTVSEGHPFLIRRKKNNGNGHKLSAESMFVRAKDIRAGDYVGYPIPVHDEHAERTQLDIATFVSNAATNAWVYIDYQESEVPEIFEYLLSNGIIESRKDLLDSKGWSTCQYKTAMNAVRDGRTMRRVPRYISFDEDLFWVLGLYLAEGNTSAKQVLFSLHSDEVEFCSRLDKFFYKNFNASGLTSVKTEFGIQRVYSTTVGAQFFHDLCPGDSRTKRISHLLMMAKERLVASLLKGYFDGDGCYHEPLTYEKCDVSTASRQLAADVRTLMLANGFIPGTSYVPPAPYCISGKRGMSAGHYSVALHGDVARRFKAWIAGESHHEVASCTNGVISDGYVWYRIEEIREVEADEVIGFEMSHDVFVTLDDDTEAHGTFCTWGMASANTNYMPIMPLPIGTQSIGGDGKSLLLSGEMMQLGEQIIMGMGVPREFLQGGLSYAGTNVSMRILENMFIGYINRQLQMVKWMVDLVAHFMEWPKVNIRFKPFKMADDLQRKAYLFQLNQAKLVSDTTLLSDVDLKQDDEDEIMERELDRRLRVQRKQQIAQAEIQGEAQVVMMKLQAKAMQAQAQAQQQPSAPGEPGGPPAGPGAPPAEQMAFMGPPPPKLLPPVGGSSPSVPESAQSTLGAGQDLGVTEGQAEKMPVDLVQLAEGYASQALQLPEAQRAQVLSTLEVQMPELYQLVIEFMTMMQKGQAGQATMGPMGPLPSPGGTPGVASSAIPVDMRPLPEKLPPRRDSAII